MMTTARTILSPEQQNMERRLRDCDGCHDPKNRPIYRMMVDIASAHGGTISQSVFLICHHCQSKPIQLYLHGSGHCAPGIRTVDDGHTLGKDNLDRPVSESGATVVEEIVEPPVEIIEPATPPKRRRRARARKRDLVDCEFEDPTGTICEGPWRTARPRHPQEESPKALDPCAGCGHQRGFHIHGPCGFDSLGRGCRCRGFQEK